MTKIYLPCLTLALVAGCSVGPNYSAPKTSAPTAFENGAQTNLAAGAIDAAWWHEFHDAQLEKLVTDALAGNHDLKVATANLREARALRRQAQFDYLPVVNGNASYTDTRYSEVQLLGAPGNFRHQELYDMGFDATWELDVFGRVRRANEAAKAELQASYADLGAVRVSLIGEVARNYFELRGAQNELAVARRNVDNQRDTLKITEAILEGGRGTELDVARARAELNTKLAAIPPLESAVAHAIHRLGVLTGRPPTALTEALQTPAPLPALPAVVSIGDPDSLLRRRPDVRAAERTLAAATARTGVATADLFPRVTFNGNIGLEAASFANLVKPGADTWSFGPSITWAALDFGHVRARINAADARAQAALATYERTVLTTLEETENALVDYGHEQSRRDFLSQSEAAGRVAADLARQRYEAGATDFLTVLDAERVLYDTQDQLAQSQTRTATALVAIYKSLGGGAEAAAPPQTRADAKGTE